MTKSNATLNQNQVARLLDESRWLAGLARRLVLDPGLAEDLTQETLVAAIGAPSQPEPTRVRGWLATILRRKLASEKRRSSSRAWREEVAAPEEALPDAHEVAELLESERLLRDALVEIAEPYRRALTLRYREGLSAAEIARRDGEPAGTVRSRLHTGLGMLRQKLEDRDREWRLALAPMTHLPSAASAAIAPLAPTAGAIKGLVGIAAAALVAVPVAVWHLASPGAPETAEPLSVTAAAAAATSESTVKAAAVQSPEEYSEESAENPAGRVAASVAPVIAAAPETGETKFDPGVIELVVVDEAGQPIAGAHAERWDNDVTPRYSEDSDANGLLSIQLPTQPAETVRKEVNLRAPGRASVHLELTFRSGTTSRHTDVVLPLAASVRGTVHDPLGAGKGIAVVMVSPLPESFIEQVETSSSLDQLGEHFEALEFLGSFQGADPATGEFLLSDVPPGTRGQVLAFQDDGGGMIGWSEVIELESGESLDLDPITVHTLREQEALPAGTIVARLALPDGVDPEEFVFSAGWFEGHTWHSVGPQRRSPLEYLVPCGENETLQLIVAHDDDDYLPVYRSGVTLASKIVTIEVAPAPVQELRVVTSSGDPAPHFEVTLLASWAYGGEERSPLETFEGDSGSCSFSIPTERWKLRVTSGEEMATLGPFIQGQYDGPSTVGLGPARRYRGTLTQADGHPVASAKLTLRSLAPSGLHSLTGELLSRARPGEPASVTKTGPSGEFQFDAVAQGPWVLGVEVQGACVAAYPLGDPGESAELHLELPATGSVEGKLVATHGQVSGGIVTISHELGMRRSVAFGSDGRFAFADLCTGEWFVGATHFHYTDGWLGEAEVSWELGDVYYSWISEPAAFDQRLGKRVLVAAGGSTTVELDLQEQPGMEVEGSFTLDGEPLTRRKVTLYPSFSLGPQLGGPALLLHRETKTTGDGTFSTELPMGGSWNVQCQPAGSEWMLQATFSLAQGASEPAPLDLDYETGTLVLNGPQEGLAVRVQSTGRATEAGETSASLTPGSELTGRHEFRGAPAGEITVYRRGSSDQVPIASGTLEPGGALELTLR